jgi:hypothetical protein
MIAGMACSGASTAYAIDAINAISGGPVSTHRRTWQRIEPRTADLFSYRAKYNLLDGESLAASSTRVAKHGTRS